MNNSKKRPFSNNQIEKLRETESRGENPLTQEILKPFANEFVSQIFGKKKFTGELMLGETLEIKNVVIGKQAKLDTERQQLNLERQLLSEEKILVEKKTEQLKIQMEGIQVQTTKLIEVAPKLAREVQIAAFQAPTNANIYELFFLEHIYKLIKSFTEDINNAHVWLYTANVRARKKNVWGENTKKYGARYFMSGEHYSGRSAA